MADITIHAGSPTAILLTGCAGVGKSRLVRKLLFFNGRLFACLCAFIFACSVPIVIYMHFFKHVATNHSVYLSSIFYR